MLASGISLVQIRRILICGFFVLFSCTCAAELHPARFKIGPDEPDSVKAAARLRRLQKTHGDSSHAADLRICELRTAAMKGNVAR